MTEEEFANAVSNCADHIEIALIDAPSAIAIAGCIEAACIIAIRTSKKTITVSKFRQTADLLEAHL